MRLEKVNLLLLYLFTILIYGNSIAFAGENFEKGELVCSPKSSRCGFLVSCNENICNVYTTHSINNNIPEILKPEYMEIQQIRESTIYGSKKTYQYIETTTKQTIKENANNIRKYQKVCYEITNERNRNIETRCGTILSCNASNCQIDETHRWVLRQGRNGKQLFTTAEVPYQYRVKREIKREDVITNGETIEDLLLWSNITNVYIKLVL
ncbi:MAG: hypothetical protein KAS94_00545 [Desulfobulbaceae bacterium]|nr:hypothetical protein [Desulfobulbaceae bacterium]